MRKEERNERSIGEKGKNMRKEIRKKRRKGKRTRKRKEERTTVERLMRKDERRPLTTKLGLVNFLFHSNICFRRKK
jgi:hypothetical protein